MKKSITIKINEIPDYLKNSEFYLALDINDEKENDNAIVIPSINFKKKCKVRNFDELVNILHTLRFWMVKYEDYPYHNIFSFVRKNKDLNYDFIYNTFFDMPFVKEIKLLLNKKVIKNKNTFCKRDMSDTTQEFYYKCAKKNYLLLIKYIHSKNWEWDEYALDYAIKYNNIDCLKYMHKNGLRIGSCQCNLSASIGNSYLLSYCIDNCDDPGINVCNIAAENGHLNCLQIAFEKGCICDSFALKMAIDEGHQDCVEYLLSKNILLRKYSNSDSDADSNSDSDSDIH